MKIEVSDVDEASSSLRNLLYTDNESDTISTRHIASASLLHLGEEEHLTISALYDSILQNWIAPLPLDVPLRVRQRKERLARRIAAEVMLACARIHQSRAGREFQLGPNQETTISMPILPSHPLRSSPGKSSQWASSQLQSSPPLPLSSISEPQSSPQSFPLKGSVPANPLVRLRKHLKFKEDSELHASIPANVGQLLSQWQPSTDPHDYDWEQAERASRTETVDEASQKQSEKARKRKERREKRQQREDELMRAQPSSQPFTFVKPTSFPRSSPGPMLGGIGGSSQPARHVPLPGAGIQSSQGGFNSFVAQSQVEPGKYGGRPDKKKKKKGRISGF
jgi:RNA polymerase I-specific transcription initiation factor RRN6